MSSAKVNEFTASQGIDKMLDSDLLSVCDRGQIDFFIPNKQFTVIAIKLKKLMVAQGQAKLRRAMDQKYSQV
ncbi:MAG: hypothetical protein ACREJU_17305 [Nitrospiraceae bacterium]